MATEEFDEGGPQAQENAVDDEGAELLTGIDNDFALSSDEEDCDDMTVTEEFDEGGQQAQENAVEGAELLTGIDSGIALGSDEEDCDDMTATSPGRNDEEDETPTPAVLELSIQSRPCSHSTATSGLILPQRNKSVMSLV